MSTEVFIGLNGKRMRNLCVLYTGLSLLSLIAFFILGGAVPSYQLLFRISGFVFAAFFGIIAGTYLKRFRDKAAGIYFSAKSFIDQASSVSCGEIPWRDVTGIKRVEGKDYLLIETKMNEKIIRGAKNRAVGRLLQRNIDIYGTPVVINSADLDAEMDEIRVIFRRYFERQKGSSSARASADKKKINEN